MSDVFPTLAISPFLSLLHVYDVDAAKEIESQNETLDALAAEAVLCGNAVLSEDDRTLGAAVAIPVFRENEIVSVVAMATAGAPEMTGVFEIWSPIGEYDELGLSQGYFGDLGRFKNVSSFVRFEKGSGLPGQVWDLHQSVIHDNLSSHPGFLRAAGASAGKLSTAIGISVAGSEFVSAVLLISSDATPIAKGFEVWEATEKGFTLCSAAYHDKSIARELGTTLSVTEGVPGLTHTLGRAVLSDDAACLSAGRPTTENKLSIGLGIPCFKSKTLASVTTVLF